MGPLSQSLSQSLSTFANPLTSLRNINTFQDSSPPHKNSSSNSNIESGFCQILDQQQQEDLRKSKVGSIRLPSLPVLDDHANSVNDQTKISSQYEVSTQEVLESLIQNEESWLLVQSTIRSANLVTSLGIPEVLRDVIQAKKEEMQELKRKEDESAGAMKKLRRRLSIL